MLEGCADLPLSGIFTSIPNVEPNYDSFRAAVNSIKSDDRRLKRVNLGREDWEKIKMDDLGLIVMPQIQAKYFVKIEPVIYNNDRNAISATPVSKQSVETKNVDFEIKIFAAGANGPKDLLHRSSLKDLSQAQLMKLGTSVNPKQIEAIKSIYKQSSDIYSREYQETEMLLTDDKVYLVQTRDQAAVEKHPDDAISEKLRRYELRKHNLTDDNISLILKAFSNDFIPMIIVDERTALCRHIKDQGLKGSEVTTEIEEIFVNEYKQRIGELASNLPRYQLFIKDLGITNHNGNLQALDDIGELGSISAYEDIVAGSEVCFSNDCHILRNGSRFHNLLFSPKSQRITVALPREISCFEGIYPGEKYGGYNPENGLLKNPESPQQLIQQLIREVKRSDHSRTLNIDISESSLFNN